VLVALVACGVSLFVLPAVLKLLGPRVNALAPRSWQRPLEVGDEPRSVRDLAQDLCGSVTCCEGAATGEALRRELADA
jgi:hypothetical protein